MSFLDDNELQEHPDANTPPNSPVTSSPKTMKRKLDEALHKVENMKKKLKVTQQKNRRLKKKVQSLSDVVKSLQNNGLISENCAYVLEGTYLGVPEKLMKKAVRNKSKNISKSKYPEVLKAFAITLQFYSTKAYNYVRRTFHLALSHPSTIRRWYQSINGKPGFTQEAFHALFLKVQDAAKGNDAVICGLVIDEMAIRKHQEWDGDKFIGFTDIGNGTSDNNDCSPLASEAYVFMAVSLNSNWKVPLGYFLTDGLAASERANLVETGLLKLSDVGVKTVSLTCDGPSCNQSIMKLLGAKLDVDDLDPSFTHPGNANEKIHVILDVCHMLKLVRNTLATQKIIIDGDGGMIRWELTEELHKIQDKEGLVTSFDEHMFSGRNKK